MPWKEGLETKHYTQRQQAYVVNALTHGLGLLNKTFFCPFQHLSERLEYFLCVSRSHCIQSCSKSRYHKKYHCILMYHDFSQHFNPYESLWCFWDFRGHNWERKNFFLSLESSAFFSQLYWRCENEECGITHKAASPETYFSPQPHFGNPHPLMHK